MDDMRNSYIGTGYYLCDQRKMLIDFDVVDSCFYNDIIHVSGKK